MVRQRYVLVNYHTYTLMFRLVVMFLCSFWVVATFVSTFYRLHCIWKNECSLDKQTIDGWNKKGLPYWTNKLPRRLPFRPLPIFSKDDWLLIFWNVFQVCTSIFSSTSIYALVCFQVCTSIYGCRRYTVNKTVWYKMK